MCSTHAKHKVKHMPSTFLCLTKLHSGCAQVLAHLVSSVVFSRCSSHRAAVAELCCLVTHPFDSFCV